MIKVGSGRGPGPDRRRSWTPVEDADRPRRRHRDRGGRPRPPARDHARVPRPHLRVAVPAEGATDLRRRSDELAGASSTRSSTPPARATSHGDGIVLDDARRATSPTTAPGSRSRRWRSDERPRNWRSPRARSGSSSPAILVMFMQAGFAFLEAGLTRMKNVGHIAGEERPRSSRSRRSSTTSSASGSPSATAATGSSAAPASSRRSTSCSTIGQSPFSWFSADPGAAGYLFEVVVLRASRSRSSGARWPSGRGSGSTSPSASSSRSSTRSSRTGSGARTAGCSAQGMQDFAGSTVVHYQGALAGLAGRAPARAADRQVRRRREAERDPGPQHGVHDARRDHPLVRLVRLQPGLDAERRLRRRRLLRLRRAEHEPRGGGRRARRGHHVVARDQEARPLDDAERRDRGARRDHGGVRVRRPVGGDRDRLRRRARSSSLGVLFVERIGIDDPVGALAAHGMSGVWGTLSLGFLTVPALAEKLATGQRRPLLRRRLPPARRPGARPRRGRRVHVQHVVRDPAGCSRSRSGSAPRPKSRPPGLDVSEHGMWGYPSSTSRSRRLRHRDARPHGPCRTRSPPSPAADERAEATVVSSPRG